MTENYKKQRRGVVCDSYKKDVKEPEKFDVESVDITGGESPIHRTSLR